MTEGEEVQADPTVAAVEEATGSDEGNIVTEAAEVIQGDETLQEAVADVEQAELAELRELQAKAHEIIARLGSETEALAYAKSHLSAAVEFVERHLGLRN